MPLSKIIQKLGYRLPKKECEMGYEPTWIHCFQTMWTGSWAVSNPVLIFSGAVLPVMLYSHWGASQSMNWESHSWPTRIEWNDRAFWTLLKLGFDIQKWEFTNATAAKKCGDLTSKKVDSLHWKRYASKNVMGIGMKSIEIYEGCIILYTQAFRISWWTWKFVAGMCPASFIVLGFELFGGQGVRVFER